MSNQPSPATIARNHTEQVYALVREYIDPTVSLVWAYRNGSLQPLSWANSFGYRLTTDRYELGILSNNGVRLVVLSREVSHNDSPPPDGYRYWEISK